MDEFILQVSDSFVDEQGTRLTLREQFSGWRPEVSKHKQSLICSAHKWNLCVSSWFGLEV